jgi:hypothetical protein
MSKIIDGLKSAVRYAKGDKTAGRSTLYFDMTERSADRLKQMMADSDADSPADVIGNALRLYEACLKEVNVGGKVIVRRADGSEIEAMTASD